MKASGFLSFKDDQGNIRQVKTIINDDYTINAFYSDDLASIYKYYIEKADQLPPPPKSVEEGLGDWVKKVIDMMTFKQVKPCGACKKRQEMLNKLRMKKEKVNEES